MKAEPFNFWASWKEILGVLLTLKGNIDAFLLVHVSQPWLKRTPLCQMNFKLTKENSSKAFEYRFFLLSIYPVINPVKQFDNLNPLNKISNNILFTLFFFLGSEWAYFKFFCQKGPLYDTLISGELKESAWLTKANKHIVWHIVF